MEICAGTYQVKMDKVRKSFKKNMLAIRSWANGHDFPLAPPISGMCILQKNTRNP
jgi:hypothetical protein